MNYLDAFAIYGLMSILAGVCVYQFIKLFILRDKE